MMNWLFHRGKSKGQSTAEYAIVIALVIAAVTAMQVYVKRSLQGGVKFTVDKLKKDTGQYEPYYSASGYATNVEPYEETEQTKEGGEVKRTLAEKGDEQVTTRHGRSFIRDTANAD